MSEGGGSGQENFLMNWDNEAWVALSNSDNSAGRSHDHDPDQNNLLQHPSAFTNINKFPAAVPADHHHDSNNSTPCKELAADHDDDQPGDAGGSAWQSSSSAQGIKGQKRKRKNGKQQQEAGISVELGGGGEGAGGGEQDQLHIWTERERRKKMRCMFSSLQSLLPQLPPKADKSTIVDEAVNYIRTLQQTLQRLQKQKLEMLQAGLIISTTPTFNFDHHLHPAGPAAASNSSMITPAPHYRLAAAAMDSREAFLADHHQGSASSSSTHHDHLISTSTNSNLQNQQLIINGHPRLGARLHDPTAFRTWAAPNMVLNLCGDKAQINICCPKKHLGLFTAICYFLEKHKLEVVSAHVSSDNFRTMYMVQAQANHDQYSEAFSSVDDIFHLATGEIMMYMSSLS